MQVIATVAEMANERAKWTHAQVGFVATMGYLHKGHLSLVRRARAENETLVASIFVNPAQFGPREDLALYPRDLPHDLEMLESLGVNFVFTPSSDEMYPRGFVTYVDPTGPLGTECEGAYRPGHFRGVATVVLKLFQIIRPHRGYFGQKDAQQVAVISRMIEDFNLPVTLNILSTVRESDGLAMSSRNAYLTPEDRATAKVLYQALQVGRLTFEAHPRGGVPAVTRAMARIIEEEPHAHLDYAEVRDPHSFTTLTSLRAPALLAIAVKIGSTRLIDNFLLHADGTWDAGIPIS